MVRIGAALFNADHGRLADEVTRAEVAGLDFLHFDVFDGSLVPDLGFPPRTLKALRPLTRMPFEVHLVAADPTRHLAALAEAGADLVFLPTESTPLVYEAIFAVRERGMRPGLCLALGTPLTVLEPVLSLLDAVLLLGRVTGEGQRGRAFNDLLLGRLRAVRRMIDDAGVTVDLQAAGGLETDSCIAAVEAGATALPIGGALYREPDRGAYVRYLRQRLSEAAGQSSTPATEAVDQGPALLHPARVLVASRSFGPHCPDAVARLRVAGCELLPNDWGRAPIERELTERIVGVDALISGTEPVTAAVLAAADQLKVISKHGVGYENIDLAAARARGTQSPLLAARSVILSPTWRWRCCWRWRDRCPRATARFALAHGRAWSAWNCAARRSASLASDRSARPWPAEHWGLACVSSLTMRFRTTPSPAPGTSSICRCLTSWRSPTSCRCMRRLATRPVT